MNFFKLIALFTLFVTNSKGQDAIADYLIITLERQQSWSVHKTEYSYWVVRGDSLDQLDGNIVQLYLRGFSSNNLESCCLSDSLIMHYDRTTNFNFSDVYKEQVGRLVSIMKHEGRKIQTIKKKWSSGYKEKLNIYVTAIRGSFCECKLGSQSLQISGISKVSMPKSDFKSNNEFWKNEMANKIINYDFSDLKFLNFRSIL